MSITASQLIGMVQMQGVKESAAQLMEMGVATDAADVKLKNLAAGGVLVAGAALVGIGAKSVEMAGQFESSTNLLITSANEVPKNIDLIRSGLLKMSVDTATPIAELVKGMFNVESANYHGADAIKVEAAAARGAKVENADLAATTGILVTTMHDFHEPASQAVDVMNSFRMAASMGVMHLDDLNAALKNVLPIASTAGVKLTDVEAALSTMSLAGDRGASAGTHLSQMLTYLLAPTGKATGLLKEFGLTTQEISDEMKVSLPGAVQMITDAVGEKFPVGSAKYIAALSAIVGGNKSMKAMLELSGISLKTFTDDAAKLGPTMRANSTAVDGWTTVQSNLNFKLDAAKNAVEALMISVGEKLLPVVGQLADEVTPLIQGFSAWVTAGANVGDQLGVLQPTLQAVRDILPDVGTFLTQDGDAIRQNLLPPLESLITNVGSIEAGFVTWADKSGAAKFALGVLAGTVQDTTAALGWLIGATSDIIGWFAHGGLQVQVLAGLVAGLGVAFAAIKIADTVSGFQKLYATWSEGEGVLANLASAVRGKLSGAIDSFLANQAPNLKASMDSVKTSAAEAAVAEEAVSATPAKGGAVGWFAQLEGSLAGVGTAAETSAAEVTVASTEMEASLTGVGTAATTAEGEIAAVGSTSAVAGIGVASFGVAAAAAALPILALGAIFVATYELIKNKAYDTNRSVTTSTGEMVQANQLRWHQMAAGANQTSQQINHDMTVNMNATDRNVSNSANDMYRNVVTHLTDMKNQGLEQTSALTWQAQDMFANMGNKVGLEMANMDATAKGYWNDSADYINNHPITGSVSYTQGSGAPLMHNAEGTDFSPGGLSVVGERGPEIVYLPRGSQVIPHGLAMGMLGSVGNNQPIHVHIEVGGHEVLSYLIDHMGNAMMHQSILQYGRRTF